MQLRVRDLFLSLFFLWIGFQGLAQNSMPYDNATVILQDTKQLIPLQNISKGSIAIIYGEQGCSPVAFLEMAKKYADITLIPIGDQLTNANLLQVSRKAQGFSTVILLMPEAYVYHPVTQIWFNNFKNKEQVAFVLIGQQKTLSTLSFLKLPIVWVPECTERSLQDAAMTIFGGIPTHAKLNPTWGLNFIRDTGKQTTQTRLSYRNDAQKSLFKEQVLQKIQPILDEAIRQKATPGGVVMVVYQGSVLLEHPFGSTTYENDMPIRLDHVYDWASISKITATTPMVMRLYEQGSMALDSPLARYWDQAIHTPMSSITMRKLLLHEAGLVPFIPFHMQMPPGELLRQVTSTHTHRVAEQAYVRPDFYSRVMIPRMLESKRSKDEQYVYSDLSMYFLKEAAESISKNSIDMYVRKEFYDPLGMQSTGFLPLRTIEKERIVPTEWDKTFRNSLLQGDVHDQGAALAGGVAGHAGVFGTANDLAIFGQMLLNRGVYGQKRYFKAETIDLFTSNQSANSRRGLGFDKSERGPKRNYPSSFASDATYGHTGYTGTSLWIDPKKQLIFIFLSNRVYPDVSTRLNDLSIRGRLLDAVYQVIP